MTASETDEACVASMDLLRRSSHPAGFLASPQFGHYAAVWSRDAAVACLGADVSGDAELLATVEATLRTMAGHASPLGRVADAYWPNTDYADWGEGGATDATAWFVIVLADHVAHSGNVDLGRELWPSAVRALSWLAHQDVTGWGAIDSPAGGDWMDSTLNRSGKVFHVNVLYAWAARSGEELAGRLVREAPIAAERLWSRIDALFWPRRGVDLADLVDGAPRGSTFPHPLAAGAYEQASVAKRHHYLSSVAYGRFRDRCDVLANVLAIGSGLAGDRAPVILDFLDEAGVARPYPSRTWPEPFSPNDPQSPIDEVADSLQRPRWRNPAGAYHNGAVWPYVGAFHAAALAAAGRTDDAGAMLVDVAAANRLGEGFHEWIHAATGEPAGASSQAWNAGAYLWASDGLNSRLFDGDADHVAPLGP
jgi:glycogen debranching enzyme